MAMHDERLETRWMRIARRLKGLWTGPSKGDLAARAAASLEREKDALSSRAVARSR